MTPKSRPATGFNLPRVKVLGALAERNYRRWRKRRLGAMGLSDAGSVVLGVAQPTVKAAGSAGRRLDIQGLRAVAVLMVVAFHAGLPVPGGFVGVDVFFVISGFVITAMLMREWNSTGRIRLGRFYVRRFKRLTPALAVTVSVVMVASVFLLSPLGGVQQTAAKTGIGAMLLAANVVISRTTGDYFGAPAESNLLLNTWSLSVEEQFYLVFPAVLLVGWLLGRRARRSEFVPVVVGIVGVVSFALSVGLDVPLLPDSLVGFYGPAARAWEFAVGALLALGGARLAIASKRLASFSTLAGAGMLTGSLWLITEATTFPGLWTLLPVVGTLLLLAGGGCDRGVGRALASRPMVAIGDLSYSVYLWHWPLIVFAQLYWPESRQAVLAAAVFSFIPAYASYRWVEQPIRALPHAGGVALARLVAATLVPPLALAGSLGLAASNGFWNTTVQRYYSPHAAASAGCTAGAWRTPADCTWNGDAPGQPIYLVGDSSADHFSEALIGASQLLHRPLVGLMEVGCSYFPTIYLDSQIWQDDCSSYAGNTEDYLVTAEPGLVVIANSQIWFTGFSGAAVGVLGEESTQEPEAKLETLSSGLSTAVRTLQSAGHTVLVVQAVPHWRGKDALPTATCSVIDMLTAGCSHTMSMEDVLDRQGAAAGVVETTARETGAFVLDLTPEICPGGTCSWVTSDGLVRYRDNIHITVEQSERLTATFERSIAAAE